LFFCFFFFFLFSFLLNFFSFFLFFFSTQLFVLFSFFFLFFHPSLSFWEGFCFCGRFLFSPYFGIIFQEFSFLGLFLNIFLFWVIL
jgi:hypothetical protein